MLHSTPVISDRQAEEKLHHCNRIHHILLKGARSTQQLAVETGYSAEDVAKAIHTLSAQRMVVSYWSEGENTKLHTVTDAGRMFAPPPPVPDFKAPDCDPRSAPPPVVKNTPRFSGTRHFEGVNGKYAVDNDGHVILDPDKPKGKIYWSLIGEKTSADLIRITGLPDQVVWNHCGDLVKMGLLTYSNEGKSRVYKHNPAMKAVAPSDEVIVKPREPVRKLPSELPPDAKKVEVLSNEKPDLTPAIQTLLKHFSSTDIALALFAEIDNEITELRAFKEKTVNMFNNIGGK